MKDRTWKKRSAGYPSRRRRRNATNGGYEAARDDDDGQKGPPFGIAEKALEVAPFPALPVEEEIAAGQEHGYSSDRFQGQAVILRKIEERIAAAGGHGHEP